MHVILCCGKGSDLMYKQYYEVDPCMLTFFKFNSTEAMSSNVLVVMCTEFFTSVSV